MDWFISSWQFSVLIWAFVAILFLAALKEKFIPASDYKSAISVAKMLEEQGFVPIINLLGEHCTNRREVERTYKQYIYLVDALHEAGIKGKISVKPTQLGLAVSKELYCDYVNWLARRAHGQKISLEIDMESLKYCEDTLSVFKEIPGEYGVRQAVQAYLWRSITDVGELVLKQEKKIRLVKGAYAESDLVLNNKNEALILLTETLLRQKNNQAIATVRDRIFVDIIRNIYARHSIPKSSFSIQMLYGRSDDLKYELLAEGFRIEVYMPVGPWHKALPYIWRRIKELYKNSIDGAKLLWNNRDN